MPKRDATPPGAPCWIDLMTSDPAASKAFYGELFGWTSEDSGPEYGGYITFRKDDALVAGGMANDPAQGAPDGWSVYLATDDADGHVRGRDRRPAAPSSCRPWPSASSGTMLVVVDPSGASIGAWQPGTHTGFGLVDEPGAPAWFELHTRDYAGRHRLLREGRSAGTTEAASDTDEFRYTTLGKGDDQAAGVMDAADFLPEGVPVAAGRSTSAPPTPTPTWPRPSSSAPRSSSRRRTPRTAASPA